MPAPLTASFSRIVGYIGRGHVAPPRSPRSGARCGGPVALPTKCGPPHSQDFNKRNKSKNVFLSIKLAVVETGIRINIRRREDIMVTHSTSSARSAAVTGAGGGLGREVALQLGRMGYRVFGTARNSKDAAEVEAASAGAVNMTICDVTDESAVEAWTRSVSTEVGPGGLDVLVSNAGILTVGPMEAIPLDRVRYAFEVNVFGSLAVINAFLPALRAARGRIVQVGSMTGSFAVPFAGPACASKAALESFAAAYRAELKPFGVTFVMARPGNMATGGPAKATSDLQEAAESLTAEQRELYGTEFGAAAAALDNMQQHGLDVASAANYVIEAIQQTPAPIGVAVGEEAANVLKLVREKSDAELDAMRREFLGLDA